MSNFESHTVDAIFFLAFCAAFTAGFIVLFALGTYRLCRRRARLGDLVYRTKPTWMEAGLGILLLGAVVVLFWAWYAFAQGREMVDEGPLRVGMLLQWTPPIMLTVLAVLMFAFGLLVLATRIEIRRRGLNAYGFLNIRWDKVHRAILGDKSRLIIEYDRGVCSERRFKPALPEIATVLREAGVEVVEDPEYKCSFFRELSGSVPWRVSLAPFGCAVAVFFFVVAWFYFTLTPEYAAARRLDKVACVSQPDFHIFSISFYEEVKPTEEHLRILHEFPQLSYLGLCGTELDDSVTEPLASMTQLIRLGLEDTAITDKTLARLSGLKRLRELGLDGTRITGDGLRHLEGMQDMENLHLRGTEINAVGLVSIGKLRKLRKLDLSNTSGEAEAGFAALGQLRELRELRLVQIPVEDAWLVPLASLSELISLDLRGTNVTGEGLKKLAGLKNLLALSLDDSRVTDRGVETLAKFTQLERLSLSGTRITDASAETLKKMTHLEMLTIRDTAISPEVAKEIAEALGEDVVAWGEREEQSP